MPFVDLPKKDFIGKGVAWPIVMSGGRPIISTGTDLVSSSIKIAIVWPFRTRFFLMEFGTRIEDIIEEPNNAIVREVIRTFIKQAIKVWEPRAEFIDITLNRPAPTKLDVTVFYRMINRQDVESFVIPFYKKITV